MRGLLFLFLTAVVLAAQAPSTKIETPSDVAAAPADAQKTKSGLATKVLKTGDGTVHPGKDEVVTIDYSGWTTDGKMFDSSVARKHPSTLSTKQMIPGLAEGVEMMVVGETRRLWIPESLAYKGQSKRPQGTLVFDVTLVELPTRAPADLKTPPASAQRTGSGLRYQVLKEGTGTHHPTRSDKVLVNYTGWGIDGKMFDASYTHGGPVTLPLDAVIPGWTEGIALMVEGEKARFWIPQDLAYQGKQPPFGTLVFDIELVKIQ
jgi:peptidylprolyl isomerase